MTNTSGQTGNVAGVIDHHIRMDRFLHGLSFGQPKGEAGAVGHGSSRESDGELNAQPRHGVLECMDGGHPTDAFLDAVSAAQKSGEDIPVIYDLPTTYGRWAGRLACEYKLRYGIPKRTEANRLVVKEWLWKRLEKKNTRYAHMRSVIPLALEMVFLKDATDLELDSIMLDPEMVARAHKSVEPYWAKTTWVGWAADLLLPAAANRALGKAFPGTFRRVPGFTA